MQALMSVQYAPVAQLDRVTGYEPVGRGFESLPAYQKFQIPIRVSGIFYLRWKGLEKLNAARTSAAADGLTEANLNFHSLWGMKMQTSPFRRIRLEIFFYIDFSACIEYNFCILS